MPHARKFGAVIVVSALALVGCASRAPAAADHVRAARSVKAAAVGYYRSISHAHVGSRLRFACTSGDGMQSEYTVTGIATGPGAIIASVERGRSAWVVALKQTRDDLPFARYRVLREASGYCVDRALSN